MRFFIKRYLAALSLIILFAITATAASWERAVALYDKGDYRAALAEFQDIVRDRADVAGAWYYIGLCEFKLKRYDRVELPLERAIALLEIQSPDNPDIAGAWYTVGISHYLATRYDKAVEPLKQYMELRAKAKNEIDAGARAALGRSYFFLERYDEALPLLTGAATANEKANEAGASFYYIGVIHFKREDDDNAIIALRKAVNAAPEDAASLDLLAESLMRKARKANSDALWQESIETGEKLKTVRDDLKTANILGRAYLGTQKFDEAVAPLEKLAKANPDNGQAWLYYGIALSRSNKMRKAMEALEITIQLMPESIAAMSELAYIYESDKQYQQALRIYEKAYAATNDPAIKESIERVRALASQRP